MESDAQDSVVEELTNLELVEFEKDAPRSIGRKEDLIRKKLGMSPVRYYRRLAVAIDDPETMAAYPAFTARLRRKRDARAEKRTHAHETLG